MASGGDFKKNAEQITHETEMVAAYAEVIARPGMENADDEKFRGFAQDAAAIGDLIYGRRCGMRITMRRRRRRG